MNYRLSPRKYLVINFLLLVSLHLALSGPGFGQRESVANQKDLAMELIGQNRYIDALPILEKIILSYPDDAELWAQFGMAIIVRSTTFTDVEARKEEQSRGIKALTKAKQLGTLNVRALDLLDQFEDADGEDNFTDENPEVEKALREGEAFFGSGEYESAFASYEKAYKLNPESYEAVLFMGDSRYSQKRYVESEIWFAKAAAINPDRETAHRFWGDALMNQRKYAEARDKFIEALIADPYSRMPWETLRTWGESAEIDFLPYEIIPPGGNIGGVFAINEKLLKTEDGTILWNIYKSLVSSKNIVTFAEEISALRKLSDSMRSELKAGKIKYPDPGLVNLIRIDDEGFLEAYVLLMRPRENFGDDYSNYREKNRQNIRNLIIKHFFKPRT